ncbi:MAG: hypothetical protein AAFQ87_27680, partial [Bacteroidota bacterium]
YLTSYPFSPDNLFKLAVFTELKGRFDPYSQSIHVDFGNLGTISFFSKNCLLKTSSSKVFHLMRDGSSSMAEVAAVNDALHKLFENIALLANHRANPELVAFVDESLARKNIEPFNKIFVRHILINYGRFTPSENKVEFHTDWLPEESTKFHSKEEEALIQKHLTPLRIQLDDHFLRGYYIQSGGTVYVEDVDRKVKYATGEDYDPNVSAFKVFVQKLFVRSAHYIATNESKRLESKPRLAMFVPPAEGEIAFSHQSFIPEIERREAAPVSSRKRVANVSTKGVKPLYHKYNWIGMMLTILREENLSIADPDILVYFVDKPYFDKVYAALTPEEKKAVDQTRRELSVSK